MLGNCVLHVGFQKYTGVCLWRENSVLLNLVRIQICPSQPSPGIAQTDRKIWWHDYRQLAVCIRVCSNTTREAFSGSCDNRCQCGGLIAVYIPDSRLMTPPDDRLLGHWLPRVGCVWQGHRMAASNTKTEPSFAERVGWKKPHRAAPFNYLRPSVLQWALFDWPGRIPGSRQPTAPDRPTATASPPRGVRPV